VTETFVERAARALRQAARSGRAALLVFAAAIGAALVFLLVIGRYRWFFLDEWDFLAGRDGGDLENLLIPHNEHWQTLLIVVYRVLFRVVGLRTYLPYRGLLVALHLTAAVLLRVVMRRAGINPWIATVAATLFVLFGSGHSNLLWGAQIGAEASLVFGFVHLLLADHDGPVNRRDWLGLLAGLAGLLSSAVALTMTPVVALATLVRRGWRVALLHTAPLAVLYVAWFLAFRNRRTALGQGYPEHDVGGPAQLIRFVLTGVRAGFDAMGQVRGAGWALGILLLVGLVLAWGRRDRTERRKQLALPTALFAGAILFFCVTSIARASDFGSDYARQSRYLYIFAALTIPALAMAADAVARRWRVLAPLVLVLLLVGVPGNVDALIEERRTDASFFFANRRLMLTLPRVPIADEVPRSVRPEQRIAKRVTLGWLLEEVASGRIPEPDSISSVDAATATLYVALNQKPDLLRTKTCSNATTPVEVQLSPFQSIGIHGVVRVVYTTTAGVKSRPVMFSPKNFVVGKSGAFFQGRRLVALTGPLTLEVDSAHPRQPVALCL
jgi:hypothetical protein